MYKRAYLFLTLLASLNMLAFSQNLPLKKVNFLPMWVPQPQFAGYYMAKEKGIYEKYGLDVTIINGGYGKDVSAFLNEGKADFGIMFLSAAIQKRAQKIELVNIGQMFQQSNVMFVAKKKSGINSVQDFQGKKIAIWRTILSEITTGFLNKYAIKAQVIEINEGINLFLKDAVAVCAVMHYSEYNSLINHGINPDELSTFYLRDLGVNLPEDGIYCMEETFKRDPDLCKKFVRASIEGWKYALDNPEECIKVLQTQQEIEGIRYSLVNSRWMLKCMAENLQPTDKSIQTGDLLVADFNKTVDFLMTNKLISVSPDYNIFYRKIK